MKSPLNLNFCISALHSGEDLWVSMAPLAATDSMLSELRKSNCFMPRCVSVPLNLEESERRVSSDFRAGKKQAKSEGVTGFASMLPL